MADTDNKNTEQDGTKKDKKVKDYYYEDGVTPKRSIVTIDGKVTGDTRYRRDGSIESQNHSEQGRGWIEQTFDKNGTKRSDRRYDDRNGALYEERLFDKNGKEIKGNEYYENGNKKQERNQKGFTDYREDGTRESSTVYGDKGKPDHVNTYWEDGKTVKSSMDVDSHGRVKDEKSYRRDGSLESSTHYGENGKSEYTINYDKNGKPASRTDYDEKTAVTKRWDTHPYAPRRTETGKQESTKSPELNSKGSAVPKRSPAQGITTKGINGAMKGPNFDSKISGILKKSPAKSAAPIVAGKAGKGVISKAGPVK